MVGNLEEISPSGAYVNVEDPIAKGRRVSMVCSDVRGQHEFRGAVVSCAHDAVMGYYVEMAFRPGRQWSPAVFEPRHMIRADALFGLRKPLQKESCCERGVCPKEVLAEVLDPDAALSHRVRAVAKAVASLCGGMTERESVQCFGTLFGAGPECRLYAEFRESYAQGRRNWTHRPRTTLRGQYTGLMRLAGSIDPEIVKAGPIGPELVVPVDKGKGARGTL